MSSPSEKISQDVTVVFSSLACAPNVAFLIASLVPRPLEILAFFILALISSSVSSFLPVVSGLGLVTVAPVNGSDTNSLIALLGTFPSVPDSFAAIDTLVTSFSPSKIIAACVTVNEIVGEDPDVAVLTTVPAGIFLVPPWASITDSDKL